MRIFLKKAAACLLTGILVLGAGLTAVHAQNKFWGMTGAGGDYGQGAIFSTNDDGTGATVQYSFKGDGTGAVPYGSLVAGSNGLFYGVTQHDGSAASGVIFSFDQLTNTYAKVYDFDYTNGAAPYGGLTAGYSDGKLYGTTLSGGAYGEGVLYSFDPSTGIFTNLHDFTDVDGSYCLGPLVLYNNKFYGTTYYGGANSTGAFFSFDPATNTYKDLQDFTGTPNAQFAPSSFVVNNNVLYGTNTNGNGELFSYNDAGGAYTSLFTFGSSGLQTLPLGITADNGKIYGITYFGGTEGWGGLFSFDPGSQTYSEPVSFPATSGGASLGGITAYNGKFFGIGFSSIYQFDLSSNTYTDLQDLYLLNLSTPQYCGLLLAGPPIVGTTPQTITFGDLKKTYGDADFDAGATTSSGLKITYKSSDPTIAAIAGGKIHIAGAGSCTITASQIGNPTYAAAPDVPVTLTVSPADLVITAVDTVKNQLQPNPVFRLTYTGFVNGETVNNLLTPPAAVTTAMDNSDQGVYPITISGATSNNYAISYKDGVLTVLGQYQTITFSDTVKTYGDAEYDPGATTTSGLPVTYTSSNPAVAVITADGLVRIVGGGTDTITAMQAGDAVWATNSLAKILTVKKAGLTIIVDNKTKVYHQEDPVFTATFTGLVNGDESNTIGAVFTSSDSGVNAYPGQYLINVTLGPVAANNYTVTSYQSGSLSIVPLAGASQNSLDTWFSSSSSLQVNCYLTADQQAMIQVYDAGGKLLINKAIDGVQGYNTFTLPAGALASGVYIVRIAGNGVKLNKTIRKVSN